MALVDNASQWYKMAVNQVMIVVGTVTTVFFMFPADQQKAILEHIPAPAWSLPIIATLLGIVARLIDQKLSKSKGDS